MQAVSELMSVTFAQRQNDIKVNPLPVSQLLEKYPFLKNKEIVRIVCHQIAGSFTHLIIHCKNLANC